MREIISSEERLNLKKSLSPSDKLDYHMNWKREESGKELAPSPHAACQCDGWITYAQLNAAEKFVERWLRSFQSLPMCLYASLLSAHTRIHIVAVRGIFILRIRFPKLFVTLSPLPRGKIWCREPRMCTPQTRVPSGLESYIAWFKIRANHTQHYLATDTMMKMGVWAPTILSYSLHT